MQTSNSLPKPNPGKKIDITVDGKKYKRYPIKTEVFKKGDEFAKKIAECVKDFIDRHPELDSGSKKKIPKPASTRGERVRIDASDKWFVIVSEKIIAISQGRSYLIKDIKPSWWANTLSKFVTKTPYGIGLGSPWTMELAIGEVGLTRILFASICAVLTKPFGMKGVFYHVAGQAARSIDGPTECSMYPSNVSAKLGPKEPSKAACQISQEVSKQLSVDSNTRESHPEFPPASHAKHCGHGISGSKEKYRPKDYNLIANSFSGVVVIDANDLGRNVLGNATDKPDSFFEGVMRDNPMGQGREGTPVVVFY